MVQWSSPVVKTSVGNPLFSTKRFSVTKCSPWLVSKQSPRLLRSELSYKEIGAVKTSAGKPLISTKPFAVTKCCPWLVSKRSSRLLGSELSYAEICFVQFCDSWLPSPFMRHLVFIMTDVILFFKYYSQLFRSNAE
jgi:hypothetical protein